MNKREHLIKIFNRAIGDVEPSRLVKNYVHEIGDYSFKRLFVAGFGKTSVQMAKAMEDAIGKDLITEGIVITKYGHSMIQNTEYRTQNTDRSKKIKIFEAGHPVPDENGLKATEEMVRRLKIADEDTLVLCLISGGGSALLVSPYEGISLAGKQSVTELLLRAGADITELNTVRKHISRVKGGRLAEVVYPARIISLILADVIGDRLDVIASGPTAPDSTTYTDALDVINKFDLTDEIPFSVMEVLKKGEQGLIPETPKDDSPIFRNVKNIIIGNNKIALESARMCAEEMGYRTEIISSEITGEAREAGKRLADIARSKRSNGSNRLNCLISGGETTVTVKGNGEGGRNMELALSFAMEIEGIDGITFLSAGTDGTDGPTDAAGAIVDGETVKKARAIGLDPLEYLNNNDSYNFFKKIGALFVTGSTGTNVMDIHIMVIE